MLGPIGIGDRAAYELGLARQADDAHVEVCLPNALGYSLQALNGERAPGGFLSSVLIRLWEGGGGVQGNVALTYRNGHVTTRVLEPAYPCKPITIVQNGLTMGLFKGIDADAKEPQVPKPFNHIKLRNETARPVKKLQATNNQVPAQVHKVQNLAANTPLPASPYPTNFAKSLAPFGNQTGTGGCRPLLDNTGQHWPGTRGRQWSPSSRQESPTSGSSSPVPTPPQT
jgi:hypothetical protein